MKPALQTSRDPIIPSDQDSLLAREAINRLSPHVGKCLRVRPPDGEEFELPAVAAHLLERVLTLMASGHAVSFESMPRELGVHEAARVLGVSCSYLNTQIDSGNLDGSMAGGERRLRLEDVIAFRESIDARRHDDLDQLSNQAQDLDMGY